MRKAPSVRKESQKEGNRLRECVRESVGNGEREKKRERTDVDLRLQCLPPRAFPELQGEIL